MSYPDIESVADYEGYYDEPCPDCEGTGHKEGCDSLEPAWDIGDLIARSGCIACCPNGCKPEGFQADQDATAAKAQALLRSIR